MVSVRISLSPGWEKQLATLRKSSVNVATAKALTFTAQDARDALKVEAPGLFVLRRNWIIGGIRYKPASGGRLNAVVGSIDKYMERHVIGANSHGKDAEKKIVRTRRGKNSKLATGGILIKPYGSIGSAKVHTVNRRALKRQKGQKRKPFQIEASNGKVLIVRRRSTKRLPLQVLAVLKDHVDITPTWNFFGTVKGVVTARFPGHFMRAAAKASKR
jgi:hypothetical protein